MNELVEPKWTICPRCKLKRERDLASRRAKHDKSYGKVPAARFIAEESAIRDAYEMEHERTMWERSQIVFDHVSKTLNIDYSAKCELCMFAHRHSERKAIAVAI